MDYSLAKALNYIPVALLGFSSSNCPPVIILEDETWVLHDKNLKTAHYERKKE